MNTYLKTSADFILCPGNLQDIINADPLIIGNCESLTIENGVEVSLIFSNPITTPEEDALDDILENWDNSLCFISPEEEDLNDVLGSFSDIPGAFRILKYGNIPAGKGSTRIPLDYSTPKITEGTELFSSSITPSSDTKKILISISLIYAAHSKDIVLALFRDSTCIGVKSLYKSNKTQPRSVSMMITDSPACDTEVTYSLRVGTSSSSGTWYINRESNQYLDSIMDNNGFVIGEFE